MFLVESAALLIRSIQEFGANPICTGANPICTGANPAESVIYRCKSEKLAQMRFALFLIPRTDEQYY